MASLVRLGAIVRADLLVRLRKPSSVACFLVLCFGAYLWVPDPSTGMALMSIGGQRVLYDSPAMAFGTAVLCSSLLALFGFYLVSHSISYDLRTRCGQVIAATPVRSWEYLVGKGLGNVVFLSVLVLGYLASSMVMQLVRGESPLDPTAYAAPYLLLIPPTIVFVSMVALLFESVPRLAGRLGDALYPVVWSVLLALSLEAGGPGGENPALYFDFTGMALMAESLGSGSDMERTSIGVAQFDPELGVRVWEGMQFEPQWILSRGVSILAALPILLLAIALFHRFDPSRSRPPERRGGRGRFARLGRMAGSLGRPAWTRLLAGFGSRSTLPAAMVSDAALTMMANSLAGPALALALVASLVAPYPLLTRGVLPAVFALLAFVLAGAASRESRAGTELLIGAVPRLKDSHLGWKLGAALLVALAFTAPAVARLAAVRPAVAFSLLTGVLFTAGAATALGAIAGTPKAFIILFLSFWYVVLNDGGRTAALDFAGFFGVADLGVRLVYLGLTAALLALAGVVSRVRSRR